MKLLFTYIVLMAVGAVFAMMIFYGATAQSQDNWIRCKYTVDGTIQSFPGTQCPPSWYPI
jgi:hypothetical protein